MKEKLVIGIIADTSHPAAVERLLGDLVELARLDVGLAALDVILLENPSGPEKHRIQWDAHGLVTAHCIGRSTQEADCRRGWFGNLKVDSERLPISTARTLLQRYAHEHTRHDRACVWILDEDLRLHPLLDAIRRGERCLSEHIACLRDERIDVAIGPVLGAPPLPARSSVRVNLEDVVRHLREFGDLGPRALWPDRSAANALLRTRYPEYYYDLTTAHEDPGRLTYWMEPRCVGETVESVFARLAAVFPGLIDGVPITRMIPLDREYVVPSIGLARGGNTLIIEPRLFGRIPNIVPIFDGRACRRSDMVWARLAAHLEGARFARVPLPVWQDRTGPGRSGFDEDKLVDDARGSALVRTMDRLISEGMLSQRTRISPETARCAAGIFHENLAARMDAIRRSEARAHHLLDEIDAYASKRLDDATFTNGRLQLKEGVAALRAAMGNSPQHPDMRADSMVVERFFLDMHAELVEYRRGAG